MKATTTYLGRGHRHSVWGILILLVVYLTGVIQPELHREFHAHESSVVHSVAAEEDGCHQSIFHHKKDACKHKAHATPITKCLVCQSSLHADHDIVLTGSAERYTRHHTFFAASAVALISIAVVHTGSRAPPVS